VQPSTKKVDIDLEALVQNEAAYVTIDSEFDSFVVADAPENLETEYTRDRDGSKVEFLVSTLGDMVSEETKVLLPISDKFYHFFIDSLPTLLKIHRQDPSILFVLYIRKTRPNAAYEQFLTLLSMVLSHIEIKHKIIAIGPGMNFAPTYQFNNYILIDEIRLSIHDLLTFPDIQYAIDIAIRCAGGYGDSDVLVPFRKVYLTRRGAGANIGPVADNYKFYKDDLRMYDEEKLEKFFSDLGYEIVEPETRFESIMDQICYMRGVKTLVSVTSSGLANMIFMQENQTIIEIQSEIVQALDNTIPVVPVQSLHSYYQPLSFMNQHLHISIPSNRDPDKVIEVLTKDAFSYIL
jgi:hypothetical protein